VWNSYWKSNLPPAPTHHQQQQLLAQPQHQVEEEAAPYLLEYPGLLTPSTETTSSESSSRTQLVSLPSSPITDAASWSDSPQGFEQNLWDPEYDTTQTTAEQTSSPSPTLSPPN
jgi:hypothetical protein